MVDWVYKCVFVTKIGVINCVTCSTTYGLSPGLYIVLMYKQTKKTTLQDGAMSFPVMTVRRQVSTAC